MKHSEEDLLNQSNSEIDELYDTIERADWFADELIEQVNEQQKTIDTQAVKIKELEETIERLMRKA